MAEWAVGPESDLRNQAAAAELRRCVDLLVALRSRTIKRKIVVPASFNAGKRVGDYNACLRNGSTSAEQQDTVQMAHNGSPLRTLSPSQYQQPQ
jgi:hypothetical protein